MIPWINAFALALSLFLIHAVAFAADSKLPKVWIYTDMSDPTLPGTNHRGTINDPDDVSAMAGYLLMANRFETLGIVVASTHRQEHAASPDQADWANRLFGTAYRTDLKNLQQLGGFPEEIRFTQSCIKSTGELFAEDEKYESLEGYRSVKALLDAAQHLADGEVLNVLCWGSVTEPAILVAHCLTHDKRELLGKLRFIAHWTSSSFHQGTAEHPEDVSNCREDAAACRYMKSIAASGRISYFECGAIGQHGIVSGSPKGKQYYDQFRTSQLGTQFVEGKFVRDCVDHSDSATYWTLLGEYGVSLTDIAADGSNTASVEKRNEGKLAAASQRLHDELLRRSVIAGGGESTVLSSPRMSADRWEMLDTLGTPTARHEAAMVGFEGKCYLLGGRRINPVNVFDPWTGTWTAKSVTPLELHHFQGVVVGDRIYLMGAMTGGYPTETPLEKIVVYSPNKDQFEFVHSIPEARRRGGAGAVYHDGKIYLVGGITHGHMDGYQSWFDAYDPQTGDWEILPDAPHARDHFQAVVIENRLYAAGGRQTSKVTQEVFSRTVAAVDVFDFETGQWLPSTDTPVLPTPRAGNSCAVLDGKLVVAGGESGGRSSAHAEVEVYSPESAAWSTLPSLQRGRHGTGVVRIGDYFYTASGSGGRGGSPELNSTERLQLRP
ncbi:Kelch repeat-containing protein [Aureliella helgolandensis]|uniref:N-acetylneuraminate epimerase n=1 Tax=Aureliella helgolandensis TaxID=2527968 RepID=A0A518G2I9_9BACT|nr:nucleoside hydrolase-like domain-containing protein [Aureliella helgolandensis]QDV22827.1 N-acetylneuraminate epimerase [Aureliella helgolandensis]